VPPTPTRKPHRKAGFIYVIVHPSFPGFCKVGRTSNLQARINVYNCSCPKRRFAYLYTRFFEDCVGAEAKLRTRTIAVKLRGEWLRIHPDDARALVQGIR